MSSGFRVFSDKIRIAYYRVFKGGVVVSNANFRVKYAGPALEEGAMDVRDLAPALLALGDLCQRANRLLNGKSVKASVRIRADIEHGSFDFALELVQVILATAPPLTIQNAPGILAILGLVGSETGKKAITNVLEYFRQTKGAKPISQRIDGDGNVTLNMSGNEITVIGDVHLLVRDASIVRNYEKSLSPVEKEGIDRFETRDASGPGAVITKEDERRRQGRIGNAEGGREASKLSAHREKA